MRTEAEIRERLEACKRVAPSIPASATIPLTTAHQMVLLMVEWVLGGEGVRLAWCRLHGRVEKLGKHEAWP